MQNKKLLVVIVGSIVFISAIIAIRFYDTSNETLPYSGVGEPGSEHIHARFVVHLDGTRVMFSPHLTGYAKASEYIFLDGKDGTTIHRFATGATLGMFFDSLDMKFNSNCFIVTEEYIEMIDRTGLSTPERQDFCNEGEKTLKLFVNVPNVGDFSPNPEFEKYVPKSIDRILIIYGIETKEEIRSLFTNVGVPYIVP